MPVAAGPVIMVIVMTIEGTSIFTYTRTRTNTILRFCCEPFSLSVALSNYLRVCAEYVSSVCMLRLVLCFSV